MNNSETVSLLLNIILGLGPRIALFYGHIHGGPQKIIK